MSCSCAFWKDECRTFSDRVPGYAQGAVFPGDEGGWHCEKSGEPCEDPSNPLECHSWTLTGHWCPVCAQDGLLNDVVETDGGVYVCRECGDVFSSRLAILNAYGRDGANVIASLVSKCKELESELNQKEKRLNDIIKAVKKADPEYEALPE